MAVALLSSSKKLCDYHADGRLHSLDVPIILEEKHSSDSNTKQDSSASTSMNYHQKIVLMGSVARIFCAPGHLVQPRADGIGALPRQIILCKYGKTKLRAGMLLMEF